MAIHFDGSSWLQNSSFAETLPANTSAYTILLWVNVDAVAAQTPISSGLFSYNGVRQRLYNSSHYYGYVRNSANNDSLYAGGSYAASNWYLAAIRLNTSAAGPAVSTIPKGGSTVTTSSLGASGTATTTFNGLAFGTQANGTESAFSPGSDNMTGSVSQAAVFLSYYVTDAELVSMAAGSQLNSSSFGTPDHWYKFSSITDLTDYGSAATLYDVTQGGAGTITTTSDPYNWSGTSISVSDTLSLSDSITSIVASVSVSDALVIADAISALAASVPISDVLALADSVSVSTGTKINVSDTLSLSDILSAIDATLSPADTMALADTVNVIVAARVTDSLSLSDSVSVAYSINPADSLSLSDSASITVKASITDNLTILDSAAVKNALSLTDSISLADAVTVVKGTAKSVSISDTLTLSDELLGTLFARSLSLVPSLKSRLSLQTSMNGVILLTPSLKGTVQLH